MVFDQPGHKYNNPDFHSHTGLRNYPKYMLGGGYIFSDDVAQLIVLNNKLVRPITIEVL